MRDTLKRFNYYIFTPTFFAWSYIFLLYLHNIGELSPRILILPLIVVLFVELTAYFVTYKKFGINTSIILLSIFSILFFSYGDSLVIVHYFFDKIQVNQLYVDLSIILAYIIILIFAYVCVNKFRKYNFILVRFLSIVSILIICNSIVHTIYIEITQRFGKNVFSHFTLPQTSSISQENLPDIYYIVPDSYAGSVALKDYFGYDNSTFTNFLKNNNFYVAENSTSNYPKTFLSLTSSLNMEYIDYLSINKNSINETLIDTLIKNNNLVLFLKKQGYSYYQLGSWWWSTKHNIQATKNYNLELINPVGINAFNSIILNNSILKPILPHALLDSIVTESVDDKRRRIVYQFEMLPEVAKLPGPKLVFAHIIAPHGPNVFGKNCENIQENDLKNVSDEIGYTNQIQCINTYLSKTIETILKASTRPPVIIIQSDEGAPFLADRLMPSNNWKSADTGMLQKKFPIFAAYYFPDKNYDGLYQSITPVNAFRVVLNKYFNTNIPLLPDRNYVNLDMQHLYEFKEVTNEIKN
jgi:hypothetical protein